MAPNGSRKGGGILSFFRSLYDLDTLDTRFTTPSSVPYNPVALAAAGDGNGKRREDNHSRGGNSGGLDKRASSSDTNRPRWGTPEFFLYYLVFAMVIPYMFWIAYDVSRPSDPRYYKYHRWLSPGWVPGRKIDVSDAQYGNFRRNLPVMALLVLFHPLCRKVWDTVVYRVAAPSQSPLGSGRSSPAGRPPASPEMADARLRQRTSFDFCFAILYLVILHGFSALKILAILGANYQIATVLPKKYIPAATWVFNICTLFANELCDGYRFRNIAMLVSADSSLLARFGAWLDSYGGIQPRWAVLFNITILRLVSFNLDYYWSLDNRGSSPIEKQLDPANLSEKDRVAIPAAPADYSFFNFVGYAIYAPLYLTGPIITFNDYISQQRYKPATIETARTVKYGVRFFLTLLSMELLLHYDYVGAISKANPDWSSYTPAQISLLSYFNLHIIWLKLLLPWRFFRLWSLVDGIDPPENMLRCVSDNYSTLSFWRSWHRSYYRWLLRYIYIPLGGSSFATWRGAARSIVTYLMVFTFVALWHDIKMRMLIWGWLIVFFFLPEILAGYAFPRRRWENRPTAYRMLCGVGGVLNVLMMISANLVGFAVGLDGLEVILRKVLGDYSGLIFITVACSALFVGIQVMFEIRASEARRGINMKC
ncbi:MBOAT, membrane-bound O-acyltransferase family-domain-containing protein [Apodospora peruviana]|uniref:MBOAT, membrane-bound O-acyltransferase family-domain-containing protein n=1 Tax=Apodospora peruviana TaxID=516989 RepID=A0AAE0ISG1_9PEZI|nr:MBOAT, membrane-bound O-acyltransferase family-domain-containing protein [Apodospora peruviana]